MTTSEREAVYQELSVYDGPEARRRLRQGGLEDEWVETTARAWLMGRIVGMEEILRRAGRGDEVRHFGFLSTWDRWVAEWWPERSRDSHWIPSTTATIHRTSVPAAEPDPEA